jgi:hypothetical protein
MSEKFLCEFCDSSFSTKSNLRFHQKQAKKCLLLQNKTISNEFRCNICDKIFTTRQSLKEHVQKCSINISDYIELKKNNDILVLTVKNFKKELSGKDKQIKDLQDKLSEKDKQIKDLQDKLGNIAEIGAKKHTTTTNNYTHITNNLIPYDLNREKIYAIVNDEFTENHLYGREISVANFAINNLLTNDEGMMKMTCTDTSRKVFYYKDNDGKIYKDYNANEFLDNYIPAVKQKSYQLISNKDGNELVELANCISSIEPSAISTRLASKLAPKSIS